MSKNKKIKYIIIVILVIIASYLIYFYQNKFITYFESEVSTIYFRTTKELYKTNPKIKSYGEINGTSCNGIESHKQDNIDYYIELDEDGNVIKLYVTNGKKKYIKEGIVNLSDMSHSNMEDYISKSRKFKFDCEGNILHK